MELVYGSMLMVGNTLVDGAMASEKGTMQYG